MPSNANSRSASLSKMVGYGLGECANSLIMNGFFGFAELIAQTDVTTHDERAG